MNLKLKINNCHYIFSFFWNIVIVSKMFFWKNVTSHIFLKEHIFIQCLKFNIEDCDLERSFTILKVELIYKFRSKIVDAFIIIIVCN